MLDQHQESIRENAMNRIGLALSGGGFRATIYHIGVLRFLYDADLLRQVTHVTSVSGGSIMAAHLVLNWDRYTGSEQEFEEATNELLDFVRLDVRNRIVRRYPLALVANCFHWFIRQGWSRRLTRAGLLEKHYEKHLFGDKCLYELPTSPQLHMLATNVNEGCLCSFTRKGILAESRLPNGESFFSSIPSALATVPMGVAASSAFPGFFPPIRLTAKDVGADQGRFPPHVLTDGGVYDNLGVRMFQHIRESWIGHDSVLTDNDFIDLEKTTRLLDSNRGESATPLGRLANLVFDRCNKDRHHSPAIAADELPTHLWNVIVYDKLYCDPCFRELAIDDEQVADMFKLAKRGRHLDRGEHLWLNRSLVNAAFESAGEGPIFRSTQMDFDTVIVSDAGKEFHVSRQTTGGGLLATGMRASDILMDRVWRLEVDHFNADKGFVFAPISTTVNLADDPEALHPELQRQVAVMRTDLDKFSDLEISGLIRHGYGVMRQACRERHDLFSAELPSGPPWDPTSIEYDGSGPDESPSKTTQQARKLQNSSQRKILGRLIGFRDWPTYLFLPLFLALIVGVPYFAFQKYKIANRSEMIVDAITFSNPDFQLVLQITRQNPVPGDWETLIAEDVAELEPPNFSGIQLITDTRVLDARAWRQGSTSETNQMVSYRRMLVRRVGLEAGPEGQEDREIGHFRIQQFNPNSKASFRSSSGVLNPVVRAAPANQEGEAGYLYEAEFDLSTVPSGENFEVGFEVTSSGIQGREDQRPRLKFPIVAPTDVATMWVLLPAGLSYRDVEVVAYQQDKPGMVEAIQPTYRFDMADGSLFGWMVVAPLQDHTYECRWTWDNN